MRVEILQHFLKPRLALEPARNAGIDVKFESRDVERAGVVLPVIVVQFWRRGT
jgi:hypothetical protein